VRGTVVYPGIAVNRGYGRKKHLMRPNTRPSSAGRGTPRSSSAWRPLSWPPSLSTPASRSTHTSATAAPCCQASTTTTQSFQHRAIFS
jgi:hypothetical protein